MKKPVWRMEPSVYGWSVFKTTRTKVAKYERVDCGLCDCTGMATILDRCNDCNGKGYTLEAIK